MVFVRQTLICGTFVTLAALAGCKNLVASDPNQADPGTDPAASNEQDEPEMNDGQGQGQGQGQDGSDVPAPGTGCVSDRIDVPEGASCTCEFDSCDAKTVQCACDLSCYGDTDCLIELDADGNPLTDDDFLSGCTVSCNPEGDMSTEMTCSAGDCEIEPNTVDISPVSPPSQPAATSLEAEREVSDVDVLFVIDNSGSMKDNQMAAACAMDSFYNAANQNGASFQTGVITTDMVGESATRPTYQDGGWNGLTYVGPPELVSLDGACTGTVSCGANCEDSVDSASICEFDGGGDFVESGDPGSQELLTQLVVQGDDGSYEEGGLEQAFQFYADQERNGVFDSTIPKEIVVVTDEQADADELLCPFNSVNRDTGSIPNFNPPTPTNQNSSCEQDLKDFYAYYFSSRNITVHGLLYAAGCNNGSTEEVGTIYSHVVAATGGQEEAICQCDNFDEFFTNVGASTSTLSTEICFPGSLPDASTIQVVYVETGAVVPRDDVNGWSIDVGLNCIVMNGDWKERYGSYRVDYIDPDAPPPPPADPVACLDAGLDPLVDTIRVICAGAEVPQSSTEGYVYDPVTKCFTFYGSYMGVDGSTCNVEYI